MKITEGEDFCKAIIRLGTETRMNEPGVLKPMNWRWRMLPGAAAAELAKEIAALTTASGRI